MEQMLPGETIRFTAPLELNSRELEEKGICGEELMVYGNIPMMVTAQCLKKTLEGCTGRPELLWMKDRKGKEFPVKNHCRFCYNTIYNSSLCLFWQTEASLRDWDRLFSGFLYH